MLFHWHVEEAKAEPLAIVATSSTAAPAENIFFAERIPSGHWENAGRHRITHYDSGACCNGRNAGRTASGAPMMVGRTVATGRQYPFGTRLLINGTIYTVEDRGVPNGCIDILVGSHAEANRRGLFHTNVFVWRED
ncbi:MAG: 3D domain-containing protein [Oscillospiraceae bacterium]|nr:3D domain-containing protein [Oscillospiraceae bacterium]